MGNLKIKEVTQTTKIIKPYEFLNNQELTPLQIWNIIKRVTGKRFLCEISHHKIEKWLLHNETAAKEWFIPHPEPLQYSIGTQKENELVKGYLIYGK